MTTPPRESEPIGSLIAAALEELGRYAGTEQESRALRFSFVVPTMRQAVTLAADLRVYGPDRVQVRPVLQRLRRGGQWSVVMTTRPAPLVPAVLGLWLRAMNDLARDRDACRLEGGSIHRSGA